LAINAAKAIGCHLVNIDASNLMEGKQHLVLGVAWQIIRKSLLVKVTPKHCPELFRLLEGDEPLETLDRISPEKVLLR
jgi:plastin-1